MSIVEITDGKYKGAKLIFADVKINNIEPPVLSFIHEMVNDYKISDVDDFKKMMGGILEELIFESLEKGDTIYTGGT